MEVDEAITLILKTSDVNNVSDRRMRDLAKPVVLTLGCLALAVAQAGAVIRQGVCGMGEYCELYLQRRKELLSQNVVQGGEDYRYTVYHDLGDISSGDRRNVGRRREGCGGASPDVQLPAPRWNLRGDVSPSMDRFVE